VPRLDRLVARNLAISRRRVEQLILAERVRDRDGHVLADPRLDVPAATLPLEIRVDERRCRLHDVFHLLQHKPVGVVTALRDARHPTAYALLGGAPLLAELRPIGRLDVDCSGLLAWTSDGARVQRLAHPRRAVPREYHVALAGEPSARPEELVLADGHRPRILALDPLAPGELHPALVVPEQARAFARVVLTEGRHHEVKRIFAALHTRVVALARTSFGPLALPRDLAPGAWIPGDLP
jgi:16S rRNA pseudouridine516 synthase